MENNRLSFLLSKVNSEEASTEEHQEMMDLMADPKLQEPAKEILLESFYQRKPFQDVNDDTRMQILDAILSSQDTRTIAVKKTASIWPWAAAAVFLIATLIGIRLYFVGSPLNQTQQLSKVQEDIMPGRNQATLTLADGSVVSLNAIHDSKIVRQAGLVIKKQEDGTIRYEIDNQNKTLVGTNTISTPMGGKYTVVLPDKTTITLNSASSVTYPLAFGGKERLVSLKGEAYFEVSKDPHRPFIVATSSAGTISAQQVEVLGTHFNINAYADGNSYQTTLLEGRIRLSINSGKEWVMLAPGDQAKVNGKISISQTNTEAAVAWKNEIFYFSDEPIESLMKRISRWYDVDIEYKGTIPKTGFWGQVSMKKPLSEVLDNLETTGQINFEIKGRKIIVSP